MNKQSKLSELRWPIGIILAILGLILLSIWTIEQANKQPVVMDDYYFDTYQNVEMNINDIIRKQQAFDKKYDVTVAATAFNLGKNRVAITLKTKEGQPVDDANITVKITRPDTDIYDQKPKVVSVSEGRYRFEEFNISRIGRWQIMTKITTPDQLVSFSKTEVNATR